MTIRFAQASDMPHLLELGRRMHQLTRFRSHPFEPGRLQASLEHLLGSPDGRYAFLVAESAGRAVGALIGVMERQIFSAVDTASVMHFDVLPEFRMGGHGVRLLRAFERWARNRRAFEISFGTNSGIEIDTLRRFALRMGYAKVGENYVLPGSTAA